MPETNAAGKIIEAHCTKCKRNLDHIIVAMEGDAIARVRCQTCGSAHKFKDPAAAVKVRRRRTPKNLEAATTKIVWETSIAEAAGKEREYDMRGKYRVGDIVNHATFGKGIVVKLYETRCDILFQDKERLMASTN